VSLLLLGGRRLRHFLHLLANLGTHVERAK
jgi:hypothetical protein